MSENGWSGGSVARIVGGMQEVEGFDKADYPLHAAAIAEWEGFLFVNLAAEPETFESAWAPMLGRLARFGLPTLQVGHRVVYEVEANWKLVFQNYSECLHCPVIHPELTSRVPYQSSANDLVDGPFLGGCMDIGTPHQSVTTSGRSCGRAPRRQQRPRQGLVARTRAPAARSSSPRRRWSSPPVRVCSLAAPRPSQELLRRRRRLRPAACRA